MTRLVIIAGAIFVDNRAGRSAVAAEAVRRRHAGDAGADCRARHRRPAGRHGTAAGQWNGQRRRRGVRAEVRRLSRRERRRREAEALVGAEPKSSAPFGPAYEQWRSGRADVPFTVGNYWPYATTIFDYVRRAMPASAPGSLTANETYSLVAWLLASNGVIADTDADERGRRCRASACPLARGSCPTIGRVARR